MTQTYSGGCACGAVRYKTDALPVFENHCQCRDCQQRSGTGHSSYLTFASKADVTVTGHATEWRVIGDSGHAKTHAFCPTCGTPVYLTFDGMPNLFTVHATSLDDPTLFHPNVLTYAMRGLDWDVMDAALTRLERS